jgi:hypothetical protein
MNDDTITGHFEITPYRHGGKLVADDEYLGKPMYTRDGKHICGSKKPEGDWYYALNDGHLDVGPFISREAAIADATRSIEHYRDVMGGPVRSITVGGTTP